MSVVDAVVCLQCGCMLLTLLFASSVKVCC